MDRLHIPPARRSSSSSSSEGDSVGGVDMHMEMPIANSPFTMCRQCWPIVNNLPAIFDTSLAGSLSNHTKMFELEAIDLLSDERPWHANCPVCRFFRDMAGGPEATSAFLKRVWPNQVDITSGKRESAFLQVVVPDGSDGKVARLDPKMPLVTYMPRDDEQEGGDDVRDIDGLDGYNMGYDGRACGRIVPTVCRDFTLARNWLWECVEKHTCNFGQQPKVGRLMVIDCNERKLVKLPMEQDYYTTLSYGWGTPQDETVDITTGLPERLPAVVSDAIEVTKALAVPYIWVDRYCIPQGEEHAAEKQRQIQLMGDIYANSYLTIVDASGSDASAGLAGMSSPRKRQPRIQVPGGYRLVSTLAPANVEIKESKWASRGWTFQEGELANRRLVFTPSQMYFQCQQVYFCESLAVAFHDDTYGDSRVPPGTFDPYFPTGVVRNALRSSEYGGTKGIMDDVTTYMARALTFPSDRLNAFAAMLRSYETMGHGVFVGHLVGVPLLRPQFSSPYPSDGTIGSITRTQQLLAGLSWYLDGRRAEGQWPLQYSCFPSWSWVAWRWMTDKRFCFNFGGIREISDMEPDTLSSWVKISVKFCDGEAVPWETGETRIAEKMGSSGSAAAIECLSFDAWTFDAGLEQFPAPIDVKGPERPDEIAPTLQVHQLKGLIIGYRSFRGRITTLVAIECGRPLEGGLDARWRRVSHAQLHLGLRDKENAIMYHGHDKATVAAKIIPWRKWKAGLVKLKREVVDLY
ncbi:heterokaryon incompatibility protein-domain-containing protein [Apodospora peruviana]|uniref:Heterokaryon incompatibility protein-domain-containing protein n=1 Tax=Apodospora peruviana TaxID=516989 RepID=A0AAE0MGI7_9PEZI|nr:heterokaryon incompatibility protein-domain-containing protein [Apodospora peruviana]